MANIDQYLQEIELASRGEEVRDSIIDALEAINTEGPGTMDWSNITDTPDTLAGYGVSEVPAAMVSGVLALSNIPPAAVERVVPVADDAARFALTTATVQNGDTVKVMDTLKLYLVVDDTHLDTEAGYEEYKAGTADSVDWSGVLNTPTTLAGYGITDAVEQEAGKGLSTNDYTTEEKENLADVTDAWEKTEQDVTPTAANPLVITTDSAQYTKSTVVSIEPVQDLHGYDHPWPAGGGKNIADPSAFAFVSVSENNGIYTASDADTASTLVFKIQQYNNNSFVSGTTITSSAIITAQRISLQTTIDASTNRLKFANNGQTREFSVFIPIDSSLIGETVTFSVDITDVTIGACKFKNIMLEKGSTATSYEPYSNICPIRGLDEVEVKRTGFNQWDEEWELGSYNSSTGAKTSSNDYIRNKNIIRILPNTQYFAQFSNGTMNLMLFYDAEQNHLGYDYVIGIGSPSVIATPSNAYYMNFRMSSTYGTTYNHDICINISDPEKNGTYEPFKGEYSVSSDLPSTVYGGTLDLESGELVVDYAIEDMGDMGWTLDNTTHRFMSANRPLGKLQGKLVCSAYNGVQKGTASLVNGEISATGTQAYMFFRVVDEMFSDATSFTASVVGQKLVYELATPITYTLTPHQLSLLEGTNVITVNGKTVKVTYREGTLATLADVAQPIETAKKELLADIKPILGNIAAEETSPAASGHAVGSYLIYKGNLYKVIAAILAGEPLIVGTNVSQTTVMDELIALTSQ